jgi:hypothetical protein
VAATLRAALNALATVAPAWLPELAPLTWDERYGKRLEDTRLPPGQASRDASAQMVGEDGCQLRDALDTPETPAGLRELPLLAPLRQTWPRHDERAAGEGTAHGPSLLSHGRCKRNQECPPAAEAIASPYDPAARSRQQCDTQWPGEMVHGSETCEPTTPPLLTPGHTTTAAVYEAPGPAPLHQTLSENARARQEHCVDGASSSAP